LSLQVDPLSQRIFAYSILLYGRNGQLVDDCDISCCIQIEEAATLEDFTAVTASFAMDLQRTMAYLVSERARPTIFLPSEYERRCVQDVLVRCIAVDKHVDREAQAAAKQVLLTMFNDAQMLLIDTADIPEMLHRDRAGLKVAIIEEFIRENVALPVPGFHRLQDLTHYLLHETADSLSESEIYQRWENGEDINIDLETRVKKYYRIIQAFRNLAEDYTLTSKRTMSPFILSPDELQFASTIEFKSPYLGKLCFFKMLETVTACERMRMERFKGFGSDDDDKGGIHLRFVGYEEVQSPKRKIKSLAGRFQVLSKYPDDRSMDTLKITKLVEYILVEDSNHVRNA
jgi:hypothetical protein